MSGLKIAALIGGGVVLAAIAVGAGYMLGNSGGSPGIGVSATSGTSLAATTGQVPGGIAGQQATGSTGQASRTRQGQATDTSVGSPPPTGTPPLPPATPPVQLTVMPSPTKIPPTPTATATAKSGIDPTLVELDPNLVIAVLATPTPDIQLVQIDPNLLLQALNVPPTITSLDVHACGVDVVVTFTASEQVTTWLTIEPVSPAGPVTETAPFNQMQGFWSWSEPLSPMTLYNIVVHVRDAGGAEAASDPVTVMTTFPFMGC